MASNKKIVGEGDGSYDGGNPRSFKRCHHSHPVIKLDKGEIIGGSCRDIRKGYDIYVGLDWEMAYHPNGFPWSKPRVELLHYPIPDGGIPGNVPIFKQMVTWLCNQLQEGHKVHIGCIGGHGRTGLLLSAIVAELGISKDAIQWVRANHCKKAVESETQVEFLMTHYAVSKASPSKSYHSNVPQVSSFPKGVGSYSDYSSSSLPSKAQYTPAASKKNIWN